MKILATIYMTPHSSAVGAVAFLIFRVLNPDNPIIGSEFQPRVENKRISIGIGGIRGLTHWKKYGNGPSSLPDRNGRRLFAGSTRPVAGQGPGNSSTTPWVIHSISTRAGGKTGNLRATCFSETSLHVIRRSRCRTSKWRTPRRQRDSHVREKRIQKNWCWNVEGLAVIRWFDSADSRWSVDYFIRSDYFILFVSYFLINSFYL